MINKLRKVISKYITKYCNTDNWEETRFFYAVYSYISFLVIALDSIKMGTCDIRKSAIDVGLEEKEIIEYLLDIKGANILIAEIRQLLKEEKIEDINALYQEFLSVDYVVNNKKVVFEGGKNNRDTLGSYYTQEDFAFEIAKKAIDEYINNCETTPKEIRVVDFSCGGGAFLVAAKKYCVQKNVQLTLFGVDVDPIAVMITRTRLYNRKDLMSKRIKVVLGNPLLKENRATTIKDSLCMALKGRFYNSSLGIEINEKYDLEIGNPPWEKIRFEEKKFLAHYVESGLIDTKQNRKNILEKSSEANKSFYSAVLEDYESAKAEIKGNSAFKTTNCGELNTYALFTEYALNMLGESGVIGLIIKTSLLKMPIYSTFMKSIMHSKKVYEVYMFVNRNKIFNIDSREEFSVIFFKDQNKEPLKIAVNLDEYKMFYMKEKIVLSRDILYLLNPETGMIPNIKDNKELEFLCRIHSSNPTFGAVYNESHFGRLVHLTNHSQYIVNEELPGYLPIYEGKFIELYTGKYATFSGMENIEKYRNKATARPIDDIAGTEYPESRYFIETEKWSNISKRFKESFIVVWRSLTSATNRRTMLATVLPLIPTCQSIQMLQLDDDERMLHVLALFNSIIFDYIVRLKMAGLDLTQTIIKQIPVPNEENYAKLVEINGSEVTINQHILWRLNALYKDDTRVSHLFKKYDGKFIENENRKQIIAELDILVGLLYGLNKEEVREIANTFDKYYTNEEVDQWF